MHRAGKGRAMLQASVLQDDGTGSARSVFVLGVEKRVGAGLVAVIGGVG